MYLHQTEAKGNVFWLYVVVFHFVTIVTSHAYFC